MKNSYLVPILVFVSATAWSQDKIYKKGGEIVEARITEVGTDEIKYKIFNDQSGPMYSLDKNRIIKVLQENGMMETYKSNLKDPNLHADQAN